MPEKVLQSKRKTAKETRKGKYAERAKNIVTYAGGCYSTQKQHVGKSFLEFNERQTKTRDGSHCRGNAKNACNRWKWKRSCCGLQAFCWFCSPRNLRESFQVFPCKIFIRFIIKIKTNASRKLQKRILTCLSVNRQSIKNKVTDITIIIIIIIINNNNNNNKSIRLGWSQMAGRDDASPSVPRVDGQNGE